MPRLAVRLCTSGRSQTGMELISTIPLIGSSNTFCITIHSGTQTKWGGGSWIDSNAINKLIGCLIGPKGLRQTKIILFEWLPQQKATPSIRASMAADAPVDFVPLLIGVSREQTYASPLISPMKTNPRCSGRRSARRWPTKSFSEGQQHSPLCSTFLVFKGLWRSNITKRLRYGYEA